MDRRDATDPAASLRAIEARQREARLDLDDAEPGPFTSETLPVAQAARDPLFGDLVGDALELARIVAGTEHDTRFGSDCGICGGRWSRTRRPAMAIMGQYGEALMVALACDRCLDHGEEAFDRLVEEASHGLFKVEGVERIHLAPGGRA